jgi:hypothetical protein
VHEGHYGLNHCFIVILGAPDERIPTMRTVWEEKVIPYIDRAEELKKRLVHPVAAPYPACSQFLLLLRLQFSYWN